MSKKAPETDVWTVAQAKAKLSEVIEEARHRGPQAITCNGKSAVVVVDADQWESMRTRQRRGNFADFLLRSPLPESGLETSRLPGVIRSGDL